MFEQRGLAVQTGLIDLATPQSCLVFLFLSQMGENDSSFQETNLMTEESPYPSSIRITSLHHSHKSLPRLLCLSYDSF